MSISRRGVLKGLVTGGAVAALSPLPASARERRQVPEDAVGMLYDATLCIGCKTCVVACREANDLPPATDESYGGGLYDAPDRLSAQTKNIIELYKEGEEQSYVKRQCMHCVDPGCASACMIGALQKREGGIVSYEIDKCVGCRYCEVACPFNIPQFEWNTPTPKIVKCELCRHLLAQGKIPACCEVCPRHAVIFGKRDELLAEAKRRLEEHPERYVPKVYGEHDGGGTQVLYLAGVAFGKLGLPSLGDEPGPALSETVQHGIYKGFIAPVVLYAALGAVLWRNRKQGGADEEDAP